MASPAESRPAPAAVVSGLAAGEASARAGSAVAVWLFVAVVFGSLATAYYFAFSAAHQAQIRDVPLATGGGRR